MHSYDWLTSDESCLQRRKTRAVWSCYVSWKYLLNFYLFCTSEIKFVMGCVTRGVNGMATECEEPNMNRRGGADYSVHVDELN